MLRGDNFRSLLATLSYKIQSKRWGLDLCEPPKAATYQEILIYRLSMLSNLKGFT